MKINHKKREFLLVLSMRIDFYITQAKFTNGLLTLT